MCIDPLNSPRIVYNLRRQRASDCRARESVIPLAEQYRICETAFDLAARGLGVGRVIARPFVGVPGAFVRAPNRHDYALDPTGETLLDLLKLRGDPVTAIGKISDLFAGRGITCAVKTSGDAEGMDRLEDALREIPDGMIFVNLVDCDTIYGQRNDVPGYAANLERFDERLGRVIPMLRTTDLLAVTADHGNDPTMRSTDHSREYVPLLLTGPRVRVGADLGTRGTFADLGQTLAENFGVGAAGSARELSGELRCPASVRRSSSGSTKHSRPRRRRAPLHAGVFAPNRKTTCVRRSSTTGTASSTARRSGA